MTAKSILARWFTGSEGRIAPLIREVPSTTTTRAATACLFIALIATLTACGGSASDGSAEAPTAATTASRETPAPLGEGEEELEPGTHVVDLVARAQAGTGRSDEPPRYHLPKIEITVPEGWFNHDGWAMGKGQNHRVIHVLFYDVAEVYETPCKWASEPLVDPGPDVDSLASALARQPLRNATAPTDIELAGFRGKYLELSVPTEIDFDDCDEGDFRSWTARGWAGVRYHQAPGQVDRIWILDVDGERLVVDAAYLPEATRQDRAELERVVDSIRFLD
jgi:hypothetical protein